MQLLQTALFAFALSFFGGTYASRSTLRSRICVGAREPCGFYHDGVFMQPTDCCDNLICMASHELGILSYIRRANEAEFVEIYAYTPGGTNRSMQLTMTEFCGYAESMLSGSWSANMGREGKDPKVLPCWICKTDSQQE
ncbi:hypothetical protein B0H10DRAFT_1965700 [Mycena sp. CBHHK59/15]|nr:hypothetical protein B0H10DRAFT_1965700 [Mycena sp. CBHHK59/15]